MFKNNIFNKFIIKTKNGGEYGWRISLYMLPKYMLYVCVVFVALRSF